MGFFNKIITPIIKKIRPHFGVVAVPDRRDKYSTHPSQNLDPQELGLIFREAEEGNIQRQAELFEEMEEKDTHLLSQLQTRKYGVSGLDWSILPASDDEIDREIAERIGAILYELEDMDDLILDLLDAIGKGFSVAEIMWTYEKGLIVPKNIVWRHPKKFRFDEFDRMKLITPENGFEGIPIPENKFIIHKYKARSGSLSRAGVLRVVAWMYLFKNYAVKDWLAFSEVYGMPIRLGKYESGTSQEDKEALMEAIRNIGADAGGVISKDTEIQFIESQRSEGLLYDRLIRLCNAEMSKAILGQTLTTEVGAEGGSRALGDVQNLVRYDILKADCKALEKTLRRDLIGPMVIFNFGEGVNLPNFKLNYERPEDLEKEATKYQTLISLGLPVSQEHLYEKFGIPTPTKGQKILAPPSAAPAGMLGGMPFKKQAIFKKVDGQKEIDQETDRRLNTAQTIIEQSLNTFLKIIEEAETFEGLREKIIECYHGLPPDDLEALVEQAVLFADMQGRAEVLDDA